MADAAFGISPRRLARLPRRRLVAITGAELLARQSRPGATPSSGLQERGRVVFTAAIDGAVFARHGTTHRDAPDRHRQGAGRRSDGVSARLRAWRRMSRRCSAGSSGARPAAAADRIGCRRRRRPRVRSFREPVAAPAPCAASGSPAPAIASPTAVELAYETVDWTPAEDGRHHRSALRSSTRFSRSAFPAPSRIRPSSCNRPRWRRSRRPCPAYRPHLPANVVVERPAVRCPARNRDLCRRGPCRHLSRDPGRSTRPSISSRPRPTTPRTPSASGAAGFSATAPAPARAARSPASCSTTGSRAAAGRSGSPNPTS